jgi:hypothetical protein
MSNIDPSQPTYGEATTQSMRTNFASAKSEIEALQQAIDDIDATIASGVKSVAGRTGAVVLNHLDITDWAASLAPYAPKANPVFTGPVTLAVDPGAPLEAATRRYVDSHSPGGGIVVLPGGSIQAAINTLPATGGTITLSVNTTYVVDTTIMSHTNNVRLLAPNWTTVIQRGASLSGDMLHLFGDNCLVEGMTFDGNGTINTTGQAETFVSGANSRVTNVQVINSAGGINIAVAGRGSRVDHCTVTGMGIDLGTERGYGIWACGGDLVFVEHNSITGTGIDAIGIGGPGSIANANHILGCHCYAGGPGGQLAVYANLNSGAGIVVSNNFVGQGGSPLSGGIELNGNNVTVTGNTVVDQYMGGIGNDPPGVGWGGNGLVITGNTVVNVGLAGGGGYDGIVIAAGTTDFVIVGNRVSDDQPTPTMRWAIAVTTGASDRYVIAGNLLGPNSDVNNGITDGGTGTIKVIAGNAGEDTIVPARYSQATLQLYGATPRVFHLWNGGATTITAIDAASAAAGSVRIALPNAAYTFQAGNNIGNTVTTTPDVPLMMVCDDTGKWWLDPPPPSGGPFLPVSGGMMTGAAEFSAGIGFGGVSATGADLSKHIDLYYGGYGINIANSGLGVVANYALVGNFMTGWNGKVGAEVPNTGVFTTLSTGQAGFNGTAPIAKPTVSGSWGGIPAGKALSTALAAYGLVTDNTTA